MNITAPIKAIIALDSSAVAAVGTRVYNVVAPQQATMPYVVVNIVATNPTNTKNAPSEMDNVLVQLDVWASSSATAQDAAEKLRRAIDYFRGDVEYEEVAYAVAHIAFRTYRNSMDDDKELHRIPAEYNVSIKRVGVIGNIPADLSNVQDFESDEAAIAAGVQSWYILSDNNIYGHAAGILKKITT